MRLMQVVAVPRMTSAYVTGRATWGAVGNRVVRLRDDGTSLERLGEVGHGILLHSRRPELLERMLRLDVRNLTVLNSGELLAFVNGGLYQSIDDGRSFSLVHRLRHGRSPLRRGMSVDHNGAIWFGEYWANPARAPARVWRSSDNGRSWHIAHVFGAGTVRHIHAVQYDPISKNIWLCTGDCDHECSIGYLQPNSGDFTPVGGGSQEWRAVSLVFTDAHVYWGTDSPHGHNSIYRLNRQTGRREKVASTIGPVYYSSVVDDHLLFATSVETGDGEQDGYARVYALNSETDRCTPVLELRKDRWHPIAFGYGIIEFGLGDTERDRIWITAKGLEGGTRSLLFQVIRSEDGL